MPTVERRFYKLVSSNSSEVDDYILANGDTLEISDVGGNAGLSEDSVIQIIWNPGGADEEIILATHGDASQEIFSKSFAGDGTKKLRIKLTNDKSVSDYIGGYWIGATR